MQCAKCGYALGPFEKRCARCGHVKGDPVAEAPPDPPVIPRQEYQPPPAIPVTTGIRLVACPVCGRDISSRAIKCPHCGQPVSFGAITNDSGTGARACLPPELSGFNLGAFLIGPLWCVSHNAWMGLLALLPGFGILYAFVLGALGNQWAWQNRRWESIEHFQKVQKAWAILGVVVTVLVVLPFVLLYGLAIADAIWNKLHPPQQVY